MTDNINPPHYQYDGFEVYDVLRQVFPHDPLGWQIGKYVLRADRKNGLEDWRKARWFLDKKIAELEAAETVSERYADELAADPGIKFNPAGGDGLYLSSRTFESWRDIPDDVTAIKDGGGTTIFRVSGGRWSEGATREDAEADLHHRWVWYPSALGPFTEVL